MKGKYDVELVNQSEITGTIKIKATAQARQAYEDMKFHILLEIHDEDKDKTGEIKRRVVYNFPPDFICTGEIKASQPPMARFKLIPLGAAAEKTGAP